MDVDVSRILNKLAAFRIRRTAVVLAFLALSISFFFLPKQSVPAFDGSALRRHAMPLLACAGLSLLYIWVSAWQFRWSCAAQKIPLAQKDSLRIMFISAFINLSAFPSRIAADVYRTGCLKEHGLKKSASATILYRLSKALPYLFVAPVVLLRSKTAAAVSLLILAAGGWTAAHLSRKIDLSRRDGAVLAGLAGFTTLLIALEFSRTSLLLSLFRSFDTHELMRMYLVSTCAGALSGIPLGLGVQDLSWGLFLKQSLTASELAAFLFCLRLTGEFFNGLLGWLVSGRRVLEIFHDSAS